jgi:hypothetical protein
MCTGSRIENEDGTCESTGGFTTSIQGMAEGMATIARGESGGSAQIASGLTEATTSVAFAAAEPGYAAQRTLTGRGSDEDNATTTLLVLPALAQLRAAIGALTASRVRIDPSRMGHIFRNSSGHFAEASPANVRAIEGTVRPTYFRGADRHGNLWYARSNRDGTQTWAQVRGGRVVNGGLNQTPRPFNPSTGLSRSTP